MTQRTVSIQTVFTASDSVKTFWEGNLVPYHLCVSDSITDQILLATLQTCKHTELYVFWLTQQICNVDSYRVQVYCVLQQSLLG